MTYTRTDAIRFSIVAMLCLLVVAFYYYGTSPPMPTTPGTLAHLSAPKARPGLADSQGWQWAEMTRAQLDMPSAVLFGRLTDNVIEAR